MIDHVLNTPSVRGHDTMRALVSRRYGGPDKVEVEDMAKPAPEAGDLLIRNHASVVTAAICAARAGLGAGECCLGERLGGVGLDVEINAHNRFSGGVSHDQKVGPVRDGMADRGNDPCVLSAYRALG